MRSKSVADPGFEFSIDEKRALGPFLNALLTPDIRDFLAHTDGDRVVAWVDTGVALQRVSIPKMSPEELRERAVQIISVGGRHVDESEPHADVKIGKRLRVHAILEPLVARGAALSIRVQRTEVATLPELFKNGLGNKQRAEQLLNLIHRRKNFLVTGATASGKTTLLKAMLSDADPGERIITIEDVPEIELQHPHHLALVARQANSEGVGGITLDRLLRESLRMRPDRVVLGECRGAEIVTLLTALNTGHDGGASTLHANGIKEVPARLEALGALAGLPPTALARQAVSALHAVIHLTRAGGRHRIQEIGRLSLTIEGLLTVERF